MMWKVPVASFEIDLLKILPSSHSTATWCIMVNVSMWCLPTTAHKESCARYYYRNDKESYTFQRQIPFILQHDVYTNIPKTYQLKGHNTQQSGHTGQHFSK